MRDGVTLASGATAVAMWTDGPPAVAFKTNNGRTAVGINAWLGHTNEFSGAWGRVIVNAGRWLLCGVNSNTDSHGNRNGDTTATATATATTATAHPTATTPLQQLRPTATPTATPARLQLLRRHFNARWLRSRGRLLEEP